MCRNMRRCGWSWLLGPPSSEEFDQVVKFARVLLVGDLVDRDDKARWRHERLKLLRPFLHRLARIGLNASDVGDLAELLYVLVVRVVVDPERLGQSTPGEFRMVDD